MQTMDIAQHQPAALDYVLIVLYAVVVLWIGIRLAKRHTNAEDYFLAGRNMIWPFIGVSLFASNISSTTLIGLAGDAYHTGISVFNYEWSAAIILVFFGLFMMPAVLKTKVYTIPEYLEKRYDRRVRSYFSILTLFLNIVVDTAGSLFAGGIVLKMIFPDTNLGLIIACLAVVAGLYTIAGGLAAVIYTDFIQTILLMVGAGVISAVAFTRVGGWSGMLEGIDHAQLSLIRPLDDPGVPWLGMLLGIPILGFYFWCGNQFMTQRVLSARSVEHGRWGVLLAGLLKLPVLFIMVLPGTMAIHLYPDLPRPDLVYPTLMFDLLPTGLLGLVLAGFIAALMSQIDSTLNAASTLVTMDFIHTRLPQLSGRRLMVTGRWVTGIFMILAALWAPQIERFASLFKYLQMVLSYTVPPIVVIYLIGSFWKGATARGAWLTVLIGTLAGALFFVVNEILGWTHLHFLYIAPILFVVSLLTLLTVNRSGTTPTAEQQALVWSPALYRAESVELKNMPFWKNYRILSVILLALTAWLVVSFR